MTQWNRIKSALRATRSRRWAIRFLYLLCFVAIFANFLANDRPIVAKYQGEVRWPVFHQIGEQLGIVKPYNDLPGRSWMKADPEWARWPLVPYASSTLDRKNTNYKSPFERQEVKNNYWRHWLGTDRQGRDVLAGLIKGSRTALLVGLVAMSVALIIGIFFGGISGYFGDDMVKWPRWKHWGITLGTLAGLAYFFGSVVPFAAPAGFALQVFLFCLTITLFILLLIGLFSLISRVAPYFRKRTFLKLDFIFLRVIELFSSVPTLVLLIFVLSFLRKPTIITVMLIIGLIRWTSIARFTRSELLLIRRLPYISAAKISGLSHFRILWRHALPNALGPVVVALAFGMAGAVLLEAFLSFLGVGLPPDQVSWGSILRQSRNQTSAWWLALFPGMAIFFTVLSMNILGEALQTKGKSTE